MEHRDRATGWQHAKLSGHKNEDLVKAKRLIERIKYLTDDIELLGNNYRE